MRYTFGTIDPIIATMSFTFSGYVVSVIDSKRICLRVDREDSELVNKRVGNNTYGNDTYSVNIGRCEFKIDIPWENPSDLVGTHVKVTARPKSYSFMKEKEVVTALDRVIIKRFSCSGISIIATHLKNLR